VWNVVSASESRFSQGLLEDSQNSQNPRSTIVGGAHTGFALEKSRNTTLWLCARVIREHTEGTDSNAIGRVKLEKIEKIEKAFCPSRRGVDGLYTFALASFRHTFSFLNFLKVCNDMHQTVVQWDS
jgi:hypothetical protein